MPKAPHSPNPEVILLLDIVTVDGVKYLDRDGVRFKLLPKWANFIPEGCVREGDEVPQDGWPAWADYKPEGKTPTPEKKALPHKAAEAPTEPASPYHCAACEKTFNGPRQLRMHNNVKHPVVKAE